MRYRLRELRLLANENSKLLPFDRSTLAEWLETTRHYFTMAPMKHIKPFPLRWAAKPIIAMYFLRLLHTSREQAQCQHLPISAKPEVFAFNENHFKRKINAIWTYPSQASEFFMDQDDCISLYRDYACGIDCGSDYLERYWKIETPL